MAKHIQKVLAVGGTNGEVGLLENLFEELRDEPIDAVALVGDLGAPWSEADTYRALFKALGHADLAAFWIPGPNDAPLGDYLRESYNMEVAYPKLRGVHATAAISPGPRAVRRDRRRESSTTQTRCGPRRRSSGIPAGRPSIA